MNAEGDVAPAVSSIIDAASARTLPDTGPISVEARSFSAAIDRAESNDYVPVIAEIKPTSPTTAAHREDDPVTLATEMVDAGACALSVLTEHDHFGGSPATLRAVREAVDVPVLRKDFILEEGQLDVVAADIVLLIARFLDDLPTMVSAARDRGFQVLVEVHSPEELERALVADARFIGINNRDLASLTVDLETFETLAPLVPPECTRIAESGMGSSEDVRRMREAGADATLIGSAIMAGDVGERTRSFVEADQ